MAADIIEKFFNNQQEEERNSEPGNRGERGGITRREKQETKREIIFSGESPVFLLY